MSQINGIDPLGFKNNMHSQAPIQNLENGNPQQSAFDWYQWNLYNGDFASQLMYPGIAQYSEWAQQMVLQQYLNWWNSENERMQRGIAAGINPYLMSNGIAGATSPTASAPNSAVGTGSQSLGAIANGLGTIGSFASQGINSFAQLFKLRHEVKNLDADTSLKFEEMGFTSAQSKAMSIQLRYMDEKEQIGVWQALADLDKTKQEYANLKELQNNIIAQYDEIIAHKDLLIAQDGEVQALKKVHDAEVGRIKAVTEWQNIENQFWYSHHYKLGSPIYESIRDMIVSGNDFDVMSFGSLIGNYQGNLDSIYFNAQASSSWKTRPSTAFEMSAYVGGFLGSSLRELVLKSTNSTSLLNALSKVGNKNEAAEFNEAYDDARSELYNNYRQLRREYRRLSHSGISDTEKAKIYNKMVEAKKEYDSFTKEKFSESLISNLKPR